MSAPVRRSRIRPWMIGALALVVVAGIGAATTTYRSISEVSSAAEKEAFDPVQYADARFESEIVPQIEEEAVDLATLLTELANGADESEFGHTPGSGSAYSFPVTFEGTAGERSGAILPVTVEGVDGETTVQVQVGPALNGTALRDVTGTVSFNEFTNQLEFQEVGTEFNNRVRDSVLSDVEVSEGDTVSVTGAFTRVNPALVSVVPVAFEVQS
jgi:predicted lipoprotein